MPPAIAVEIGSQFSGLGLTSAEGWRGGGAWRPLSPENNYFAKEKQKAAALKMGSYRGCADSFSAALMHTVFYWVIKTVNGPTFKR